MKKCPTAAKRWVEKTYITVAPAGIWASQDTEMSHEGITSRDRTAVLQVENSALNLSTDPGGSTEVVGLVMLPGLQEGWRADARNSKEPVISWRSDEDQEACSEIGWE
jgi:hypothetical protein